MKNSNIISHLKKEFQTAKIILNAKKMKLKIWKLFLKRQNLIYLDKKI